MLQIKDYFLENQFLNIYPHTSGHGGLSHLHLQFICPSAPAHAQSSIYHFPFMMAYSWVQLASCCGGSW